MQSTARPEWFQTVPLIERADTDFDMVEYFGSFEIDEDATDDIKKILMLSKLAKISIETHKGKAFTHERKRERYLTLIEELSHLPLLDNECTLNDKIDEVDNTGCGTFWELLTTYKGFQIYENIQDKHILVSQSDGPCFQTRDGLDRLYELDSGDRTDVAVANAQEFIDAFVMSKRNDDPEYDWDVLGRLQLSLNL